MHFLNILFYYLLIDTLIHLIMIYLSKTFKPKVPVLYIKWKNYQWDSYFFKCILTYLYFETSVQFKMRLYFKHYA